MRNMKKYIYLFIMLVCIMSSCTRPEDGLVIPPSINANLTRFRVYQNQNIYFDATIDQEAHTVSLTIPEGIDKTTIRPEIIVSEGAGVHRHRAQCKILPIRWNIQLCLQMVRQPTSIQLQ